MGRLRWLSVMGSIAGLWVASTYLPAAADTERPLLNAMFQDHAVLQRDRALVIWGAARPGDRVAVEFNSASVSAVADRSGEWRATLPPSPAGGPYTLTARAGSGATQTIEDVLVGDVFLCSGQSNMAHPVRNSLNADAEIARSANDRIRLMTIGRDSSAAPLREFRSGVSWSIAAPETVAPFSAACLFFARELQREVGAPMGLINASWGGSRIEPWISASGFQGSKGLEKGLTLLDLYSRDPARAYVKLGEAWQQWWRTATRGESRPWTPDSPGDWRPVPLPMRNWKTWGVEGTESLDGMVWFRRTVELTAAQAAGKGARISLGAIDEIDQTWINGRPIGGSFGWGTDRTYDVPDGVLRRGVNTIVVNVLSTYEAGGMSGPAEKLALHLANGETAPLAGGWSYSLAPPGLGDPPQAPWESIVGLTTLHNAMIAPIGGYGIRAALWYQGESNTGAADQYQARLATLMADWRRQFGDGLAFLVVQLPNFGPAPATPVASGWADLREAQRRAVEADDNAGLVVTIDVGDRDELHPPNKQAVGRRLARVAMKLIYGSDRHAFGPAPLAAHRNGDAIVVTFAASPNTLVAHSAAGPIAIELCGETQTSCRYASATIQGSDMIIAADGAPATRVRHCWGDGPICNLYDTAGLPAGPFELIVSE